MSNLTILSTPIKLEDNLYCLNDIHRASGGEEKHSPNRFTRLSQTKELIAEINITPNMALPLKSVRSKGVFACKQIVLAYGMWISPKVNLAVINAFLNHQEQLSLPQGLTPEQQFEVRQRVAQIANRSFCSYASVYSQIMRQFKVSKYSQVPSSKFNELMDMLGGETKAPSKADSYDDEKILVNRQQYQSLVRMVNLTRNRYDTLCQAFQSASSAMVGIHDAVKETPLFVQRELF